jgi:hypothetical protein
MCDYGRIDATQHPPVRDAGPGDSTHTADIFLSRLAHGSERATTGRCGAVCVAAHIKETCPMLYTVAVVLLVLWLLGLVSSYTMGGFIHVLLVIAIVVVLLRVISGRKPV